MQCVILAGGLGTRMSHFTANKIPKCLIPVNGLPFIDYQLQWLSSHGVKDIVLCISHLKEQVENYVQDGSKWNLSVSYVDDGYAPLGTGGALRKALDENKLQDSFMIMYGDSFLPIDFKPVWSYWNSYPFLPAIMVVYKNNNKFDKSNADLDNGFVEYDKSNPNNFQYIDYGLSILDKSVIETYIPSNTKYNLSDVFTELSKDKILGGYEVYHRFYEIGSASGLNEFEFWVGNNEQFNSP